MQSRALFEARTGRWQSAATNYANLIKARPSDHELHHALAPLLVQNGDLRGYHALREQIRLRFGGTTNDPAIADRMAKDLLILPASGDDLTVAARLANLAVAIGRDNRGLPWYHVCKALAEYRQENFAEAVTWSQKALRRAGDVPSRDIEAYMVLSMAELHLQRPDEARAAWEKAMTTLKDNPPDYGTGSVSRHGWIDWLIAQALINEARSQLAPSE